MTKKCRKSWDKKHEVIEENVEIENYFEADEEKRTLNNTEILKSSLKQLRIHIRRLNIAIKYSDRTVTKDVPNIAYKFNLDCESKMPVISEENIDSNN